MREILGQDRKLQTKKSGINNTNYIGLISGPKIVNAKCGKTTDAGTMDRGSTVHSFYMCWKWLSDISNTS
jgi:hypothetical protein